jgi:WD40 repeat protein
MLELVAEHPTYDQLRAFAEGRLEDADFTMVESHIAACEVCCQALEVAPADSFVGRLKVLERAGGATTTDTSAPTLVNPLAVPAELADHPRYRILGLVGQGGMGAVYRAEHRRMDRLVALKVINPGLLRNTGTASRFQQEVHTAAKLDHPNIVRAHDADQAGDLHFLVMEFVEGTNLAEVVAQRGPLPVAEACEYARQVALGLQHAHERGMVHRDIKPHNLMLTPSGVVKILDFGLARFARQEETLSQEESLSSSSLTAAGSVMGTADYVAPEQASDARSADIRSDIYSLGCTLFHLLAGHPPFPEGSTTQKFEHHARTELPIPKDWPEALKTVLRKMTAKKPQDRYASPAEVALALEPLTRVPKKAKRRWVWVAAAALVLLAGGITATVMTLRVPTDKGEVVVMVDDDALELTAQKGGKIVRIRDPRTGQTWAVDTENYLLTALDHPDGLSIQLQDRGEVTLKRKEGGKVVIITGPPDGPPRERLRLLRMTDPVELAKWPNVADGLKQAGIPKEARAYIGRGDPDNVPPELVAVLGDTRFRCSGGPGTMAFTPDGKQLAVADDREEIRFLDVQTGRLVRQVTSPHAPRDRMAFSPDGKSLVGTGAGGRLSVIDAETGRLLWQLKDASLAQVDFAFSPDSKTLYLSSTRSPRIKGYETATGKLTDPGWAETEKRTFARSPLGTAVVSVNVQGVAYLRDLTNDRPARRLGEHAIRAVFSPDGKTFAVVWSGPELRDRYVTLFSPTGEALHNLSATLSATADDAVAFTPDGETLVAYSRGDNGVLVTRWNVADGKQVRSATLFGGVASDFQLTLSPDGQTLARRYLESFQVELFDTESGKPRVERSGMGASISALAFSSDGKLLASSDRYQTRLWDLATAREIAMWSECPYHRLTFSPDGKWLAGASNAAIAIHRVLDGKRVQMLDPRTNQIESIAFSPDSSQLAATGGDSVRVWRVPDGKELRLLSYPNKVHCVLFSPDGAKLLATGDAGITVWETATGLEVKHFLKDETFYLLEWLPDGKTLEARTAGYLLHVDTESWTIMPRRTLPGGLPQNRPSFPANVFSPGARFLCESDTRGFVLTQLDPAPERQRTLRLSPAREFSSTAWRAAAFSPDGRYLACGNPEGIISLLRLSEQGKVPELQVLAPTARELAELPNAADGLKPTDVSESARAYLGRGDPKNAPPGLVAVLGDAWFRLPGECGALTYSPNGKILAVASNKMLWIFDTQTGRLLREVANPFIQNSRVAFSPDGKSLTGIMSGGKLALIDPVTGRLHWKLEDSELPYVGDFAFSADGKRIGLVSRTSSVVEEHDSATGEKLRTWKIYEGSTWIGLVFSPDQRKFVTLSDNPRAATLWGTGGGSLGSLGPRAVRATFSPDGKVLAVARGANQSGAAVVTIYDRPNDLNQCRELPAAEDEWPVDAVMPDGTRLITVGQNDRATFITRWDVTTGEKLGRHTIPRKPGSAIRYALSPDGTEVALAVKGEPLVRLYDTATGKQRFPEVGHPCKLAALAWSPDGQKVASADEAGSVLVWDPSRNVPVAVFNQFLGARVDQLLFTPDKQRILACGMRDGRSWMAYYPAGAQGEPEQFRVVRLPTKCAAFSPDGQWLAVGTDDGLVSLWDAQKAKEVRLLLTAGAVRAVAFSPDGSELSAGDQSGLLIRWSTKDWKEIRRSSSVVPHGTFHLEYLLGGKSIGIATINERRFQGAFEWHTYSLVENTLHQEHSEPQGYDYLRRPLAISPGMRLFVHHEAERDRGLLLWQPAAGKDHFRRYRYHNPAVAAFSPDGRYLAVGDQNGVVSILRLAERGQVPEVQVHAPTARELAELPNAADGLQPTDVPEATRAYLGRSDPKNAPPELVGMLGDARFRLPGEYGALAYSPDGKILAVVSNNKVVWIFDRQTGALLREFPSPFARNCPVAFSPDGKSLAGRIPGEKLGLIDPLTGRLLWKLEDSELRYVRDFAFSADGKRIGLVSGISSVVEEHDAATGKKLRTWKTDGKTNWTGLAFSPDQQKFVTFSENPPAATLWDVSDTLIGSLGPRAVQATFSPDGKMLAVARGAEQGTAAGVTIYDRLGDLNVGRQLTLGEDESPIAAFMPDGKGLLTIGFTFRVTNITRWDVTTGEKLGQQTIPRQPGMPTEYAVSPDGKEVALAVKGEPLVRIQNTEPGKSRVAPAEHRTALTTLAWSPDGQKIVAADTQGKVILWDVAKQKPIEVLDWAGHRVHQILFSPDGQKVLTCASTGQTGQTVLALWNTQTMRVDYKFDLRPQQNVTKVAMSPQGDVIATANADQSVSLWRRAGSGDNRGSWREEFVLPHPSPAQPLSVRVLVFSPDGTELVTGTSTGLATRWSVKDGKRVGQWSARGANDGLHHIEYLPGGKEIALWSLAWDRQGGQFTVHFWDLQSGAVERAVEAAGKLTAGTVPQDFSPSAGLVTFTYPDGKPVLWQPLGEKERRRSFEGFPLPCVTAFSPDGRYLAVGDRTGAISLLRLAQRGQVPEVQVREPAAQPNAADALKPTDVPQSARAHVGGGEPKKAPPELVGVLGNASFRCPGGTGRPVYSPDGKLLAVPGDEVRIFHAATGDFLQTVKGSDGPVRRVVFGPDAKTVALLSARGLAEIVERSTGLPVWKPQDSKLPKVEGICFSPDGKLIALGGARKVEVWDIRSGKVKYSWDASAANATGWSELVFSPDGKKLVLTGPDEFSHFWQLEEGSRPVELGFTTAPVAFGPEGKYFALAERNRLYCFRGNGTYLHALGAWLPQGLAFSPDDKTLLVIDGEHDARVLVRWDVAEGKELGRVPLSGLVGDRLQYAFSPDGKSLAVTRDGERVVRVFDTATGKSRGAAAEHRTALTALAWSPDGQKIVAADELGKVTQWDVAKQKPIEALDWPGHQVYQILFSPDGRQVLTRDWTGGTSPPTVALWNAQMMKGGPVEAIVCSHCLAISPQGDVIATVNAQQTAASLWRRTRPDDPHSAWGEVARLPHPPSYRPDLIQVLVFSPDGTELATGTSDGRATRWAVQDGKEIGTWVAEGANGGLHHIEYLPGGKEIALWSLARNKEGRQFTVHYWDRQSGQVERAVEGKSKMPPTAIPLDFSPTGGLVALTDPAGKLVLWQPLAEKERRRSFEDFPLPCVTAFSPDGRYLAVGDQSGVISILRLAERGQVPELPVGR